MAQEQDKMTGKGMEQMLCSILFNEVKVKIQILRDYGISESRIASLFYIEKPLVRLTISKNYGIFLGDKRVEIHMEPLVKAVYLLFLAHPEGIPFKHLPDYREELTEIYVKLKPYGLSAKAIQSIEDVTNPLLNSINEKCARIRKVLLSLFDDNTAEYYYIKGKRGNAKVITLPRELINWE